MKSLRESLKWIFLTIIVPVLLVIITRLLTGEPLGGLLKLRTLFDMFVKASVPAWAFAIVLFAALLGGYLLLAHRARVPKGKLYLSPAGTTWYEMENGDMQVMVRGTFTYDGADSIHLMKFFLENTRMCSIFLEIEKPLGSGLDERSSTLVLEPNTPKRANIYLGLRPIVAEIGKPYKAPLIITDQFNRKHKLDKITFHYQSRPDPLEFELSDGQS